MSEIVHQIATDRSMCLTALRSKTRKQAPQRFLLEEIQIRIKAPSPSSSKYVFIWEVDLKREVFHVYRDNLFY